MSRWDPSDRSLPVWCALASKAKGISNRDIGLSTDNVFIFFTSVTMLYSSLYQQLCSVFGFLSCFSPASPVIRAWPSDHFRWISQIFDIFDVSWPAFPEFDFESCATDSSMTEGRQTFQLMQKFKLSNKTSRAVTKTATCKYLCLFLQWMPSQIQPVVSGMWIHH